MPYYVQLPNGQVVEVPDDVSQKEAYRRIVRNFPELADKEAGILDSFVRGAKSLASSSRTALEAFGGADAAAEAGVERSKDLEKYGEGPSFSKLVDTFKDEGALAGAAKVATDLPKIVAEAAPSIAITAAGTAAGALLAPIVPVGAATLGIAGGMLAAFPSLFGGNIERQAEEQLKRGEEVDVSAGKAALAATAMSAAERLGLRYMLGKRLTDKLTGQIAGELTEDSIKRLASQSMLKTMGYGAARGAVELPVEVTQTILERAQAGLPLLNNEAIAEYGDAAYAGLGAGASIGAGANLFERSSAKAAQAAQEVQAAAPTDSPINQAYARQDAEALEVAQQKEVRKAEAVAAAPVVDSIADIAAKPDGYAQLAKLQYALTQEISSLKKEKIAIPEELTKALATVQQFVNSMDSDAIRRMRGPSEKSKDPIEIEARDRRAEVNQAVFNEAPAEVEPTTPYAATEGLEPAAPMSQEVADLFTGAATPAEVPGVTVRTPKTKRTKNARATPANVEQPNYGANQLSLDLVGGSDGNAPAVAQPSPDGMALSNDAATGNDGPEGSGVPALNLPVAPTIVREPTPSVTELFLDSVKREQDVVTRIAELRKELTTLPKNKEGKLRANNVRAQIDVLTTELPPLIARQREYAAQVEAEAAPAQAPAQVEPPPPQLEAAQEAPEPAPEPAQLPVQAEVAPEVPRAPEASVLDRLAARAPTSVVEKTVTPTPSFTEANQETQAKLAQRLQKLQTDLQDAQRRMERSEGSKSKLADARQDVRAIELDIANVQAALNRAQGVAALVETAAPNLLQKIAGNVKTTARANKLADDEEAAAAKKAADADRFSTYPYNITDGLVLREEADALADVIPGKEMERIRNIYSDEDGVITPDFMRKVQDVIDAYAPKVEASDTSPAIMSLDMPGSMQDQMDLQLNILGKSPREVAEYLAKAGPRKYRNLAAKIANKISHYERMGVKFAARTINAGQPAPAEFFINNPKGITVVDPARGAANRLPSVTVYFAGANTGRGGMTPQILLHELAHAATELAVRGGANKELVNDLVEVSRALQQVRKDKEANNIPLTDIEQTLFNESNFLDNPREILVWGMTNPEAQTLMNALPYKGKTLASRFLEAIRKFFGLPVAEDSVLAEVLRVGDAFLDAPVEPELLALATGVPMPVETTYAIVSPNASTVIDRADFVQTPQGKSLLARIQNAGVSGVKDTLMTNVFDRAYTLTKKLYDMYGGQLRDSKGQLNPAINIASATDSPRQAAQGLILGGIEVMPDGLTQAKELVVTEDFIKRQGKDFSLVAGQNVSVAKLMEYIRGIADSGKQTYEEASKQVSAVLYAHRESELEKRNTQLEQDALAEELAGNQQNADAIRSEKFGNFRLKPGEREALEAEFQRNQDIQRILQMMDAIRYDVLDQLVKVGRLTPQRAAAYKEASGYVPIERIGEDTDSTIIALPSSRSGSRVLASVTKLYKLEMSQRDIGDVVESFAKQANNFMMDVVRVNAVGRASRALETMSYAKRMQPGQKLAPDSVSAKVRTYENGKVVEYEFTDPLDAVALASVGMPEAVSSFVKFAQRFSAMVRAGVTLVPAFAAKQVVEDMTRLYFFSGLTNAKGATVRALTGFPKVLLGELTGKKAPLVRELERLGVVGTYDLTAADNLATLKLETGVTSRSMFGKLLHLGESISKASDLSVRLAIYEQSMKETEDMALSQSRAREIINFSRRGSSNTVGLLVQTIPFFNAYLQGTRKIFSAASGDVVGTGLTAAKARNLFVKRGAMMFGVSLAYALLMADDEEYNAQEDYVRDANWLIPGMGPSGTMLAVPLPKDIGLLFKAIPERMVQYFRNYGTEDERAALIVVSELLKNGVMDILAGPDKIPAIVKPILENVVNYSFFQKRRLESAAQERGLEPFLRTRPDSSEIAKAISEKLYASGLDSVQLSPIKIDNLIRGMLGTSGGLFIGVTDAMINPNRTDRPLHKDIAAQLTGASAFLKDETGQRYVSRLYDLREKVSKVEASTNTLASTDPSKAMWYADRSIALTAVRDFVEARVKVLDSMRAQALAIDRDTTIPSNERLEMIQELRRAQAQEARAVTVAESYLNSLRE